MIQLVVHGAAGRMGSRICALADEDDRFRLSGAVDVAPVSCSVVEKGSSRISIADAIIDFSSDAGAQAAISIARETGAALMVGTTGLSRQTIDELDGLARSHAVMIAPNTSRGVAVMNHLTTLAATLLGERYEIDLIEQHHHHKRDAPSGTALRLLQSLREHGGRDVPDDRVHCIRAGDIVGDHEVQFAGPGERVTISHLASSRDVFAAGALDAAAWLAGREPGRYTVEQSLGLDG